MRRLKPMIARDVKMTSAGVVSYAVALDKAVEAEYLEDRIWKDSASKGRPTETRASMRAIRGMPMKGRAVEMTRGLDPRPQIEIITTIVTTTKIVIVTTMT